MADTHINAFIRDVEDAYTQALGALGELKDKVDALKTKYEAQLKELGSDASGELRNIEAKASKKSKTPV